MKKYGFKIPDTCTITGCKNSPTHMVITAESFTFFIGFGTKFHANGVCDNHYNYLRTAKYIEDMK